MLWLDIFFCVSKIQMRMLIVSYLLQLHFSYWWNYCSAHSKPATGTDYLVMWASWTAHRLNVASPIILTVFNIFNLKSGSFNQTWQKLEISPSLLAEEWKTMAPPPHPTHSLQWGNSAACWSMLITMLFTSASLFDHMWVQCQSVKSHCCTEQCSLFILNIWILIVSP